MRFLVDAQLPPALAGWLVKSGHDSIPLVAVGLRDANDAAIWEFAKRNDRIIVTKDDDFADRAVNARLGPQVLWLRIGNCTNDVLFAWLEPLLPQILAKLAEGSRLVEVIRIR